MTAPVDAAASSAAAEHHRAELDAAFAHLEDLAAAAFPPGWQREAHQWSARVHRAAGQAHDRAARQHLLELAANRLHAVR